MRRRKLGCKYLARQGKVVLGNGRACRGVVFGSTDSLHPDEKKAIANQANGDKTEQDKLTKAACLAVKCWAEYPQGSVNITRIT